MPERPESRPPRTRRTGTRRPARQAPQAPQPTGRGSAVRERLRRDRFLFVSCLALLGFITWAFALTWWVTGAVVPLAVAFCSIAPAFYLFYLLDSV
jgi:hypothetical protein